jgi:hypothetical protein
MGSIRSLTVDRGTWLGACVALSLGVGVAFATITAGAASDPAEATFVPIVPCRLVDTRPAEQFNVGPRDTPLGPEDTHVQQVTGANGACTIPADATGIALNVTAVEPTAASYLTIFPSDAARPTVSNLNFLPGAPPTPNKVDVRLSADGQVSVFNLAGEVHLVADAAGYYTSAGLQELSAELDGKANAADVYTTSEVDAALAGKANAADVYTQAEVEARTQMRTLTFPASGLNLPDHPGVGAHEMGLIWDYDDDPAVHIAVARPNDWTGESPVTLRIFYTRTPNAGDVRFRVGARSFDPGDATDTLVIALDSESQGAVGSSVARELSVDISAPNLLGSWWDIGIVRPTGGGADYIDPIYVRAVALDYEART